MAGPKVRRISAFSEGCLALFTLTTVLLFNAVCMLRGKFWVLNRIIVHTEVFFATTTACSIPERLKLAVSEPQTLSRR